MFNQYIKLLSLAKKKLSSKKHNIPIARSALKHSIIAQRIVLL